MNINVFLEKLRKDFPEYGIRVTEVEKFPKNYLGISFEKASNGMRGGPVFPVGMLIQMYVEKDYESVRGFISKILDEGPKKEWGATVRNFTDYSYIKKHLFFSVVNALWGRDLLEKVPHRIMADLALVVRVKVHENSSVLVKREILETWGISEEELFTLDDELDFSSSTPDEDEEFSELLEDSSCKELISGFGFAGVHESSSLQARSNAHAHATEVAKPSFKRFSFIPSPSIIYSCRCP